MGVSREEFYSLACLLLYQWFYFPRCGKSNLPPRKKDLQTSGMKVLALALLFN